jgi:hypothetical protein
VNPETKDSMIEAEIQHLLDVWTQSCNASWSALYGMAAARASGPWKDFLDQSAQHYRQIGESLLKVQAAGIDTTLRGPAYGMRLLAAAWGESFRWFAETAADTQFKSTEPTADLAVPRPDTRPERRGAGRAFARKRIADG